MSARRVPPARASLSFGSSALWRSHRDTVRTSLHFTSLHFTLTRVPTATESTRSLARNAAARAGGSGGAAENFHEEGAGIHGMVRAPSLHALLVDTGQGKMPALDVRRLQEYEQDATPASCFRSPCRNYSERLQRSCCSQQHESRAVPTTFRRGEKQPVKPPKTLQTMTSSTARAPRLFIVSSALHTSPSHQTPASPARPEMLAHQLAPATTSRPSCSSCTNSQPIFPQHSRNIPST